MFGILRTFSKKCGGLQLRCECGRPCRQHSRLALPEDSVSKLSALLGKLKTAVDGKSIHLMSNVRSLTG